MKKILVSLCVLFSISLSAQKNSVLDLENNNDFSTFSVLDSTVNSGFNLFFTGEDHRYLKSNSQLELKMFRYLHKTAGVRVFMMEFGYSLGYVANKYVQTGDSNILDILDKHTYDEYFWLFKGLRDFYDSLPENEKFELASVDLEREPVYPVKMLEYLLPATGTATAHDSIRLHIEALKALSEYWDNESEKEDNGEYDEYDYEGDKNPEEDSVYEKMFVNTRATMEFIIENYNRHKEKYETYLGANFTLFDTEIHRVEDFFVYDNYDGAAHQYLFRENYMAENVKKLFSKKPGVKAFGQFGRCHTHRLREKEECHYYYFNSLATRLNESNHPALGGKVFSCAVFYPAMWDFMDDNVAINKGLEALIDSTDKNTVSITVTHESDTALTSLAKRFNAIIINYNEKDNNSTEPESLVDIADWFKPRDKKRVMILGEAGNKGTSFTKINRVLKTDFSDGVQFKGFAFDYSKNSGLCMSNQVHWFSAGEQKINDSTSVALSGVSINISYGKDLIKNNNLDFIVRLGYGFERWKLQTIEKFNDGKRKDVFGNDRTTVYSNPGALLTAGADIRMHIKRLTFAIFGGYQLDLSNPYWRVNRKINTSTAKLSLSSYTVGASLGFNFGVN